MGVELTVEELLGLLRRRDGERLHVGLAHLADQLLHLGLPRSDLILDLFHLKKRGNEAFAPPTKYDSLPLCSICD